MDSVTRHAPSHSIVPIGIVTAVAMYGVTLLLGWPQRGTQQIVSQLSAQPAMQAGTDHESVNLAAPPFWTVIPFLLLLAGIAVLPLISITAHWWESYLNRFKVAGGLALVTLAYYAFLHNAEVEGHWPVHHIVAPTAGGAGLVNTILANAMLQEFVPFIVLLFSLYSISGGIRIACDLRAKPLTNAAFMGVGAVLASIIGTTGAAMLLIRPLLETNRERKHVAHTIVIFVFIVCNCGGCLLPIGDPPLFLGYLEGVPFLWTLRLFPEWLFVNGLLLATYFLLDWLWFHRRETVAGIERDTTRTHRIRIRGWEMNTPLLLGVVLAVAILDPGKPIPGTDWHPWMYLREVVQLCLVAISLWFGKKEVRDANSFTFGAIIEVAALFAGIFICMQPALQILGSKGAELGLANPQHFFWASGSLSSVLDNAPTYLVFFKTAQSLPSDPNIVRVGGVDPLILAAISLGSVFMGAMTYIGNGPNFMVRSIAESSGVKMPSFFGYVVYSVLILLPIFVLTVWSFLM